MYLIFLFLCFFASITFGFLEPPFYGQDVVGDFFQENDSVFPGIKFPERYYDYIIVGAGTAGCLLARRLSETGNNKILLVEAGEEETPIMDVPGVAPILQFTDVSWGYSSTSSDSSCLASSTKACLLPRGKVMGGSSTINFMMYTRGNQEDYNRWEALGNANWSWPNVKPHFERLENESFSINYAPFRSQTVRKWMKAVEESGIEIANYNRPEQNSADYLSLTAQGTRRSANIAFLRGMKNNLTNLSILKRTLATKIIFDENKRAVAVDMLKDNILYTVRARKEIILSGGAINSPQLLMLSGVGPQEHLEELGIPIIANLSVGHNFMDHIATPIMFNSQEEEDYFNVLEVYSKKNFKEFVTNQTGILTTAGGCEAMAFINTNLTQNDARPDIELIFALFGYYKDMPSPFSNAKIISKTFSGMKKAFTVCPLLMHPKSKGRIFLKNRNPLTYPSIQTNWLEAKEDIATFIAGIRQAIKISTGNPLNATLVTDNGSPCREHFELYSDDYWECYLRYFTITIYHYSGTCKMGPDNDTEAVVDDQLRVRGVQNLRVVDASIMPEVITGHTNGPTYMIADKISDVIKQTELFSK